MVANDIFTSMDAALEHADRCRVLELDGDELTLPSLSVPAEILGLRYLEEFSAGVFRHIELPREITTLSKLRRLDLRYMTSDFPEVVCDLGALEHLSLAFLGGCMVPLGIGRLSALRSLKLEGVTELPETVRDLKALESLTVRAFAVTWLPEGIDNLTRLRSLDLGMTGLTSLPGPVCRLSGLVHLDISDTFIDELPHDITNLARLQTLNFSKPYEHHDAAKYATRVKQIPQSWTELRELRTLDLAHQAIMDVSNNVREWTRLEELDLSYNRMDELPEELLGIPGLKRVHLGFNQLAELPEGIGVWSELEELILIDNPLTTLPDTLLGLKHLRLLDLRRTDIADAVRARFSDAMPDTRVRVAQ
jgi:Leucine-rich repeat (LRR) protein